MHRKQAGAVAVWKAVTALLPTGVIDTGQVPALSAESRSPDVDSPSLIRASAGFVAASGVFTTMSCPKPMSVARTRTSTPGRTSSNVASKANDPNTATER